MQGYIKYDKIVKTLSKDTRVVDETIEYAKMGKSLMKKAKWNENDYLCKLEQVSKLQEALMLYNVCDVFIMVLKTIYDWSDLLVELRSRPMSDQKDT